jgi:hypothetical protein
LWYIFSNACLVTKMGELMFQLGKMPKLGDH